MHYANLTFMDAPSAPMPAASRGATLASTDHFHTLPRSTIDDAHGFVEMLDAYRATGGLATGAEVINRMTRRSGSILASLASLAHWTAARQIVSFQWNHNLWLPMFQFRLDDMSLCPASERVIAELAPVFQGWDLACWFAHPNAWLGDVVPADLVRSELGAVLQAARAERFPQQPAEQAGASSH